MENYIYVSGKICATPFFIRIQNSHDFEFISGMLIILTTCHKNSTYISILNKKSLKTYNRVLYYLYIFKKLTSRINWVREMNFFVLHYIMSRFFDCKQR